MTDLGTGRVDGSVNENLRIRGSDWGVDRDPSFSGWYDENGIMRPARSENEDVFPEDFDFELPLVQQYTSKNGKLENERFRASNVMQKMELSGDTNDRNNNKSYVPFNTETHILNDEGYTSSASGFNAMVFDISFITDSKNSISVPDVLKTIFLILAWYIIGVLLTMYNKALLGDDIGKFPAPLLMNTFHFALQAALSMAIMRFWSNRFPSPVMSWRDYLSRVVPTALSTAMDINLSNASLVFISVTFATMCKSASPIFLLLFAFAFRLETPSVKLLGIILIICLGLLLTVANETEFHFSGFVLVMLGAVMSGFRWTMTQILLHKEVYGLKSPLVLMSNMAPVMMIATAILSLLLDPWDEFKTTTYFNSLWHTIKSCLLMSFGGALAFFMVLTEYILVSVTSAVTVTIAGVAKEVATIVVAVFYFEDEFSWHKGFGLIIIMVGVGLFNWYKYEKMMVASPRSNYIIIDRRDEEDVDPSW